MNRFQCKLAQIFPRGKGMQRSTWGLGGQSSKPQEAEVRLGGLAGLDIILNPSSQVDTGVQSSMETLPLKRGRWCCTQFELTAPVWLAYALEYFISVLCIVAFQFSG